MANYTVYLRTRNGPKLFAADFFYPGVTDSTGTGHTSGDPLDVIANDTVSFKVTNQGGGVTSASAFVSGLSIFTDNTDFKLVTGGTESVIRTVAQAAVTATADTVTVSNENTESDNFFFLRAAGSGPFAPSDPAVNRDHGNSRWVKRDGSDGASITYCAPELSTTFYGQSSIASTAVALFTTSSTAPQRGTFSMSSYLYVYADKPIHLIRESIQHNVIPTTLQGQAFFHVATRNTPGIINIFNPSTTASASVEYFVGSISNSGIYGVSEPINGSASSGVPAESWRIIKNPLVDGTPVYFTSTLPVVVSSSQNNVSDRMVIPPMSELHYTRTSPTLARVISGGAPSTNLDKVVFDSSGSAVSSIRFGDGSGSDSMASTGSIHISNTYAFGNNPRDFVLGVPNSNKIVVERWDATNSEWVIEEYFEPNGTATNPVRLVRSASAGFYVAGTTNSPTTFTGDQIWRWRGEDVFYLGYNDSFADEEGNFGYTVNYVAPVISNVVSESASFSTVNVTVNLSSNGSGGVLKYARSTASTPPRPRDSSGSSAWQTSNAFNGVQRNETYYYFASQAENFSGAFDSEEITTPGPSVGTIVANFTGAIFEPEIPGGEPYILISDIGLTGAGTSTAPFNVVSGYTVNFKAVTSFQGDSVGPTAIRFSQFDSTFWTDTSTLDVPMGSTCSRQLAGSLPTNGATDLIPTQTVGHSWFGGNDISGPTVVIRRAPTPPDLSVSAADVTMSATATTWSVDVEEVSPTETSSASTIYAVKTSSGVQIASRKGPGTIGPISGYVPSFLGDPIQYSLVGSLPIADGGGNTQTQIQTFTVTRGEAPGTNPPGIDPYGIAIYDDSGTFVTSFTEESTIIREIFSTSTTTSTSACTEIATGLTGLTKSNCFAVITTEASLSAENAGVRNIASTVKNGNTILIGRDRVEAENVSVSLIQTKGATISTASAPTFGVEIFNADGSLVIDDLANCYAVKEIINVGSATGEGPFTWDGSSGYKKFRVQLTENTYPFSAGVPVPAIQGPGLSTLIPPTVVTGTETYTSSYKYVDVIYKGTESDFNLAMLVEKAASPSYYGGTQSDYGLQVFDSSGTISWDSSWRQCVINNIIEANQFTSGTLANGTYDVTEGRDGVLPPFISGCSVEFAGLTYSSSGGKNVTGLNDMDPTNTFLLGGGMLQGLIQYAKGYVFSLEFDDAFGFVTPGNKNLGLIVNTGFYGGGIHIPAITITGNDTATLKMERIADGPFPTDTSFPEGQETYGRRSASSYHPEGFFVLARIT